MIKSSVLALVLLAGNVHCSAEQVRERLLHTFSGLGSTNLADYFAKYSRAPVLPSRWTVKRLGTNAMVSLGAPGPGGHIADDLDGVARSIERTKSADRLLALAETLLEAAKWFGNTRSYGNAIIAARCHDLAATAVMKVLFSDAVQLERIEQILSQVSEDIYSTQARSEILNGEIGSNLFNLTQKLTAEQNLELASVWAFGSYKAKLARLNSGKETKSIRKAEHSRPSPVEEAKQRISPQVAERFRTGSVPLEFFVDDRISPVEPATTKVLLESKHHQLIVAGNKPQSLIVVQDSYIFRRLVGRFPIRVELKPAEVVQRMHDETTARAMGVKFVPFEKAFEDEREAAFVRAWDPFKAVHPDVSVSRVYQAFKEAMAADGDILDQDRRALKLSRELAPVPH